MFSYRKSIHFETIKATGDRFSRRFVELLINSDALREYGTYAKVKLVQKEELESPLAVNMPLKLSMSNTGSEQIFIRTDSKTQITRHYLEIHNEPQKALKRQPTDNALDATALTSS